jgi:hypothetical protein
MRLPRGVTGFGRVETGAMPPDFAAFKAACHEVARRLKGTVVWADSCDGRPTPNFHRVALSLPGGPVEVICNARYPLAAVIRPLEEGSTELTFIDVPGLTEVLAANRLEVVPAADLNKPVEDEHLAELDRAERQQARYWDPGTVGEVMFNCWD